VVILKDANTFLVFDKVIIWYTYYFVSTYRNPLEISSHTLDMVTINN